MKKISKRTTKQAKKKLTKRLVVFVMFISLLTLVLISPKENFIKTTARKLFSGNNPIKEVEITTDDYDEEGSIKITKEAHWISKTEAELNINLETIRKTGDNKKDIVLVFDVSASMEGEKLEKVKQDASELIEYVLDKDEDNKIGLITFASQSRIISPLTNDKSILLEAINNMHTEDATNYYLAYKDIETILDGYSKESGKDLVVLFMTDGVPTDGSSAQGVYESLKEQYPYITINAIEYDMGDTTSSVNNISDGQWTAKIDSLNNVLFEATVSPEAYEKLSIDDYINSNYFEIEEVSNNATINGNKIEWKYNDNSYITGREDKLKVKLKLKEQYQNTKGLYPTNTKLDIDYKLSGNTKSKSSTLTPILKNNYDVYYDTNTPEGCTLDEIESENHFIYDNVTKKDTTLSCTGYEFKGWNIEENVTKINDDTFIMPESDVHIRAIWSRQSIAKSMDGNLHEKTTLYKVVKNDAANTSAAKLYTGEHQDSLTVPGTENIYYYSGNVTTNNVIFGGFCWQIVRTTDTGGVKLIYNGIPDSSGTCNNSGTDSIVSESSFNSNADYLSYVGYMFNKPYPVTKVTPKTREHMLQRYVINKNHYYSSDYEYNQSVANKYKLYDNPETPEDDRFTAEQCINDGNCDEILKGTYTFANINPNISGITIRYIVEVSGEYVYYLNISNGQTLGDVDINLFIGDDYVKNNDGTFTITNNDGNVEQFKKSEWITKYSDAQYKYMCERTNPCSIPMYVLNAANQYHDTERYSSNAIYANDVEYVINPETEEYEYVLKDTEVSSKKESWEWHKDYNGLNNNHYTCFNESGKCNKASYLVTGSINYYYYVVLENGEKIEEALNNMLYAEDVNATNSLLKDAIDQWYEDYLTNYMVYLEDTIFCNDRTIDNIAGFNPNGGDINTKFTFNTSNNNRKSLKCINITDSFMVSNNKAKLTYPIGLLSSDEANLGSGNINNHYLAQSSTWWTMSPNSFFAGCCGATKTNDLREVGKLGNGLVYGDALSDRHGLRPVVSLKPGIEYIDGDGSRNNPYIVDTSG